MFERQAFVEEQLTLAAKEFGHRVDLSSIREEKISHGSCHYYSWCLYCKKEVSFFFYPNITVPEGVSPIYHKRRSIDDISMMCARVIALH
jgi:hypothetical protein